MIEVPLSAFKRDGDDLIQFAIEDYGLENYFDFEVAARVPAPVIVIPPPETFFQYIYRNITNVFK